MLLDYRETGCQSKAASVLFCREIRVKYLQQVLIRYTGPGIFNGKPDEFISIVSGADIIGSYRNRPPFRHGLGRIEHEIMYDLGNLSLIRFHRPEIVGKGEYAVDIGAEQG